MTEYEKPRILSVTAQHVAELERENAKLREQLDTAEHNQTRNAREYARMCHENAKLREELAKARDPQRIGGQADPSSFVYALEQLREFRWQHATNDENAIPYINNVAAAHERENAKLRELVRELYDELDAATQYDAGGGRGVVYEFANRMHELGVEV